MMMDDDDDDDDDEGEDDEDHDDDDDDDDDRQCLFLALGNFQDQKRPSALIFKAREGSRWKAKINWLNWHSCYAILHDHFISVDYD